MYESLKARLPEELASRTKSDSNVLSLGKKKKPPEDSKKTEVDDLSK